MPSFSAARFQIPAVDFGTSPFRFLDIMHEAPLFGHRKSRNLFGSVFYLIILAGYSAVAVAAPWIFQAIDDLIPQLLCSCNVLLLVVTGIFQQYLVSQVQKIRLQGYYSFSQKLKHIVRLPFAVSSYGTAALLLVMVWRPHISFLTLPAILSCSSSGEADSGLDRLWQKKKTERNVARLKVGKCSECREDQLERDRNNSESEGLGSSPTNQRENITMCSVPFITCTSFGGFSLTIHLPTDRTQ
ncbi:unnamed protein product [Malus baccata var. baccata]